MEEPAVALLKALRAKGVKFWLQKAPDGTVSPKLDPADLLTEEDWTALKANRDALIALLRDESAKWVTSWDGSKRWLVWDGGEAPQHAPAKRSKDIGEAKGEQALIVDDAPDVPAGAVVWMQTEKGRQTDKATDCYLWCWEGGPKWYYAAQHPPPKLKPTPRTAVGSGKAEKGNGSSSSKVGTTTVETPSASTPRKSDGSPPSLF